MLRSRPSQRADRAAVETLRAQGTSFEPIQGSLDRLFELDGRIVAASSAKSEKIADPIYVPEPVGPMDEAFSPGPHRALIGTGLVVAGGISRNVMLQIHRLARTLAGHECGARYVVVTCAVPALEPLDPGGAVQQISAGGIDAPAITIPLADGYWPIGTITDHVVMVRRNDAF